MSDLISRNALCEYCLNTKDRTIDANDIMRFPSAELERKIGKWIYEKINSYTSRTYCSECGNSAPFIYKSDDYYGNHAYGEDVRTNFCPNCGADMRGEQ